MVCQYRKALLGPGTTLIERSASIAFPEAGDDEVDVGRFVLHAKAPRGNPYDGHTLGDVIADPEKLKVDLSIQ